MNKNLNLILMSYWRPVFGWFVDYLKDRNVKKIAFIMNAYKYAYERDGDKTIMHDAVALRDAGFQVEIIDLDTEHDLEKALNEVDLIYVRGGNTFDLLDAARRSGFDKLLPKLLEGGKLYASSSAGSIFPGPNLEIAINDFMSDENNVGLQTLLG